MKGKNICTTFSIIGICLSLLTPVIPTISQELFNNGNRFLRWRRNNSLVFSVLNDDASIGSRIVLEDNNPDTIGKKWRYENNNIMGINDLCIDVSEGGDLVVNTCADTQITWNFDNLGRLVGFNANPDEDPRLGCVQGMIDGDLIPLVLKDCVLASTQSFELEGVGVTASFTDIENQAVLESSSSIADSGEDQSIPSQNNEINFDGEIAQSTPENIVAALNEVSDSSLLLDLLMAGDLTNIIASTDNLTLLAPTDDAFDSLDSSIREFLLLPENKNLLQEILLFHTLPDTFTLEDILREDSLTTLSGTSLSVESEIPSLNLIDSPVFEMTNIQTGNQGTVHFINTVLMPDDIVSRLPELLSVETKNPQENDNVVNPDSEVDFSRDDNENQESVDSEESSLDGFDTISDIINTNLNTSIAATLLEETELDQILGDLPQASLFLPTNEAFRSLDSEVLSFLLAPSNSELLEEVLLYHILPEKLTSSEVLSRSMLPTLNGLNLMVDSEQASINGIPNFEFTDLDIESDDDSIVHIINRVFIPDGLVEGVDVEDAIAADVLPIPDSDIQDNISAALSETIEVDTLEPPADSQEHESSFIDTVEDLSPDQDEVFDEVNNSSSDDILEVFDSTSRVVSDPMADESIQSGSFDINSSIDDSITVATTINNNSSDASLVETDMLRSSVEAMTNSSRDDLLLTPEQEYEFELLFPTDNVRVNGLEVFQALLPDFNPTQYDAYWQVDAGQFNRMENSETGKFSYVDVSNWNWRQQGPYLITVSAFLNDEIVAQESAEVIVP